MIFTRPNIYALDPNGQAIASLRAGFSEMRKRPCDVKTSWAFQAAIHGSATAGPYFNQCQHGSYFFLPWHRMYLYYFERILRAASGDPNLALPYWDYSNTAQTALPVVFRQPANAGTNPLYTDQRKAEINAGNPLPPSDVTFSTAFALTNFFSPDDSASSFGGQHVSGPLSMDSRIYGELERQPHNTVHHQMDMLMGEHVTAAQDPIFYLHHANIDRLWKRWLDQGGGRSNPDNPEWLDARFTFFDENGAPVTKTPADILDTVARLNYRYDEDPPAYAMPSATHFTAAALAKNPQPKLSVVGVYEGPIDLGTISSVVIFASLPANPATHIMLRLEGVEAKVTGGPTYEVYLNAPVPFSPDHQSAYYVGNLGRFAMSGSMPGMPDMPAIPPTAAFDLTPIVRSLRLHGELASDCLTITFVPVSTGSVPAPTGSHLQIGRISIIAV